VVLDLLLNFPSAAHWPHDNDVLPTTTTRVWSVRAVVVSYIVAAFVEYSDQLLLFLYELLFMIFFSRIFIYRLI
jgi:hypothetical protein